MLYNRPSENSYQRQKNNLLYKQVTTNKELKSCFFTAPVINVLNDGAARLALTNPDVEQFPIIPNVLTPGPTSVNNYIGNRIEPESLKVRITMLSGGRVFDILRIVIIQTQTIYTDPGVADIFIPTPSTTPVTYFYNSPIYLYGATSYNVLYDDAYELSPNWNPGRQDTIEIPKSLLIPVVFNEDGSVIKSGKIFLFAISNAQTSGGIPMSIYSDLKYYDN